MDLQKNKETAIALYQEAFDGNARQAAQKYIGAQYIQHNPLVGDGVEPFIAYFERMAAEYPNKTVTFVRAIAEGDLVALHTHQTWEGLPDYVTMDFFRFDSDGKVIEHWDAIQEIPETSANGNTMY